MTSMRERCLACAMQHTPEGVKIKYRSGLTGRAWEDKISAPRPVTRKALYVYLHECGHVHLDHFTRFDFVYIQEYEAERYAHQAMRAAGIPVPREMTRRAKE